MSLGKTVRTEPPYSGRTLTPCPSRAPDRSCQSVHHNPRPVRDPRLHRAGGVVYLQGEHRRKGGKAVTYTICEPCIDVKDKGCVDECPVDCIYEGPRMLYIHPDECVDCGACEPVCPVTAIFYEDDVPAEWKQFTPINAEWFSDSVTGLGSPGGAAQVGPKDVDHPVVAAWPAAG
ncbi:MAG: ferredoxin family protein [Actinobacteria bacterium]|nr:MAG: ferredoxin family protein [Actinomycetota bacterium]